MAVSPFVGEFGLQQSCHLARRAEYLVGADGDAELASCAVPTEVLDAECARGHDGCSAFGDFLSFGHGYCAIDPLLLCLDRDGRHQHSHYGEERATGDFCRSSLGGKWFRSLTWSRGYREVRAEFNGFVVAGADAVHADHTSAIVDPVCLTIDAGCLALTRAEATVIALVRVDGRAKK